MPIDVIRRVPRGRVAWAAVAAAFLAFGTSVAVRTQSIVPRIWDDAALADWATPVASLGVRPGHFTAAEYYAAPADNLRTYPVYHPDEEPPGYWEWLQKQKPEPLVDASRMKTASDWIAAGERSFRELDAPLMRTNDPSHIAYARDPKSFAGVARLRDGVIGARWVVTDRGVMLTGRECGGCHFRVQPGGTVEYATARGGPAPVTGALGLPETIERVVIPGLLRYFQEPVGVAVWRMFSVPWAPDERVERIRTMGLRELGPLLTTRHGVFPRVNGSPYYGTRTPDLRLLRYYKYIDATGTHRLRGPEDIARYAALVATADSLDFGPHRLLTDAQRRVPVRYADEVLYAIGMYLLSLEPPKNPDPAPPAVIARGEQVFREEGCRRCHVPPAYTSGKLSLAEGFEPPSTHPNAADILRRSVRTDPGLALQTRKGTGFYKIPSLRGVWDRPRLLHDASVTSLEELFDPARLSSTYEPLGWSPPGITKRAVRGHAFGLDLDPRDKSALIAFLRSL
jgi:hypothetical protein